MASSKERVAYVIERLNIATDGNVSSRAMTGDAASKTVYEVKSGTLRVLGVGTL